MIEKPIPWPNGAKSAATISFDIDWDTLLHLAFPDDPGRRVLTSSFLQYEDIGIENILSVLDRYGITSTFFCASYNIEQHPSTFEAIRAAGHEIALHGYMHEPANEQSRESEQFWLKRSIEIIESLTGKRPVGSRSPYGGFSNNTTGLMAAHGVLYDSTLLNGTHPFVIRQDDSQLIELPIDLINDDWPHFAFIPEFSYMATVKPPGQALEIYKAEFEGSYNFGAFYTTIWHPHLIGRPGRLPVVSGLIEHVLSKGDVWIAPMNEIANHINQCIDNGTLKPRIVEVPFHPEGRIPELKRGYVADEFALQASGSGWISGAEVVDAEN